MISYSLFPFNQVSQDSIIVIYGAGRTATTFFIKSSKIIKDRTVSPACTSFLKRNLLTKLSTNTSGLIINTKTRNILMQKYSLTVVFIE